MGKKKDRKKQKKAVKEAMKMSKDNGKVETTISEDGFVKVDTLADRRTAEIMARKPPSPKDVHQGDNESDERFSIRKAQQDKVYREWEKDVQENKRRIEQEVGLEVPIHIQQQRRAMGKDPITGDKIVEIEHISSTQTDEDD